MTGSTLAARWAGEAARETVPRERVGSPDQVPRARTLSTLIFAVASAAGVLHGAQPVISKRGSSSIMVDPRGAEGDAVSAQVERMEERPAGGILTSS
jgi:hypothetical protein